MPGDVRAHEVDTEQAQVRLQLKGEEADVRDLVHVLHERGRGGREITEVGGMARHAQIRMGRENGASGRERDNLRTRGPPNPVTRTPRQVRRVCERHRDEGRADAGRPQIAPERGTRAAGGALKLHRPDSDSK